MKLSLFLVTLCILVVGATAQNPPPNPPPPNSSPNPGDDLGPGPELAECSTSKPCADPNSKCLEGQCLCNEGFGPAGNQTCVKSPKLGDKCKVNGQEFYCAGFGVDIICADTGLCVCRLGFEPNPVNKEECKAAERFVGAACKVSGDCTAAFTTCQSGKCACDDGFKPDGNLCTPAEYHCIGNGQAIQENGKVRTCEASLDPDTGAPTNDTCPQTHFCFTWQGSFSATKNLVGHCCPRVTTGQQQIVPVCPIGVQHKEGKCPDLSQIPADSPLPPNLGPLCPLDTYECYRGAVCCPLACLSSSSHFNANGRCYDTSINDQPCEIDAQCLPNAECKSKTCQCKAGFTKLDATTCLPPGSNLRAPAAS